MEKPKMNIAIAVQAFFVVERIKKEKASKRITKSKNLYPPIFLNIFGAKSNADIDPTDPKT